MVERVSASEFGCTPQAQRRDPALVQAAIRNIQRHYSDQGFAPEPARLRAILAVAALVRLAEKKLDSPGAGFAHFGREDAARTFLKAALKQFEVIPDAAGR